ncbi:hypothetical protein KEM55_004122, partial [Ascosphaera atra]
MGSKLLSQGDHLRDALGKSAELDPTVWASVVKERAEAMVGELKGPPPKFQQGEEETKEVLLRYSYYYIRNLINVKKMEKDDLYPLFEIGFNESDMAKATCCGDPFLKGTPCVSVMKDACQTAW